MDVTENIIKVKGEGFHSYLLKEDSSHYRESCVVKFNYDWEYWYDGAKFYIGRLNGVLSMVEVSTKSLAVNSTEVNGKSTCPLEGLIKKFKEKLSASGRTIHQVIDIYNSSNLDIELWKISVIF